MVTADAFLSSTSFLRMLTPLLPDSPDIPEIIPDIPETEVITKSVRILYFQFFTDHPRGEKACGN